jgi:hypothetical protein
LNQRPLGYEGKSGHHSNEDEPNQTNDERTLANRFVGALWPISVALLHSRFIGFDRPHASLSSSRTRTLPHRFAPSRPECCSADVLPTPVCAEMARSSAEDPTAVRPFDGRLRGMSRDASLLTVDMAATTRSSAPMSARTAPAHTSQRPRNPTPSTRAPIISPTGESVLCDRESLSLEPS